MVDRVGCETTIQNVMMVIGETPADMNAYNLQATMAMVDHTRSDARVFGKSPPPTPHESPLRNHGKAIKGWDKGHDVVSMA